MTRQEAQELVDRHRTQIDGYPCLFKEVAQKLLGPDRYGLLTKDKARFLGPTILTLYPWNVVDYLCLEVKT